MMMMMTHTFFRHLLCMSASLGIRDKKERSDVNAITVPKDVNAARCIRAVTLIALNSVVINHKSLSFRVRSLDASISDARLNFQLLTFHVYLIKISE